MNFLMNALASSTRLSSQLKIFDLAIIYKITLLNDALTKGNFAFLDFLGVNSQSQHRKQTALIIIVAGVTNITYGKKSKKLKRKLSKNVLQ